MLDREFARGAGLPFGLLVLAAAAACGGSGTVADSSAAAATGEQDPKLDFGENAFLTPHLFEVVRTRTFAVQIAPALGEQTVKLLTVDARRQDVELARAVTHGHTASITLPDDVPAGTLALSLAPFQLTETGAVVFWPNEGSGLQNVDYGGVVADGHATFDARGVVVLEDGRADIVLRSETTGAEMHRASLGTPDLPMPSWVEPNGYAAFNLPIEEVPLADVGDILSVRAVTSSREEVLGCYRVDLDQDFRSATPLASCP